MLFACTPPTVPVTGFAQTFIDDKRIANATITWLETGKQTTTDAQGQFLFCALPNQNMTLTFNGSGMPTLQSNTITVPATGLTSQYNDVTFQVPRDITYAFLKLLLTTERGVKYNQNDCQVVTTVTNYHKTLADDPQGIANATITLTQGGEPVSLSVKPFYFGILKNGKTNPFSKNLTVTSLDGGVAILNLTPSNTPYTLSATEEGYAFTQAHFICKPGQLLNISPPQGPSVLYHLS